MPNTITMGQIPLEKENRMIPNNIYRPIGYFLLKRPIFTKQPVDSVWHLIKI